MDSWEFNKIAAAVLAALLLAFGSSTVVGLMHGGHGGGHEKAGYKLPVDVAVASGGGHETAAKKEFEFGPVAAAMQTATAAAGESVFKKCKTCHTPNEGGKNAVGPNLWGVVGREMASHEGFNYSKALKEKGGKWDFDALAHFIHDPKGWARGTKMAFAGVKDTNDLANVLVYLRSLSSSPAPLPTPTAAKEEKPAPTAAAEKPKAPAAPAPAGEKPAAPAAPSAGGEKPKAN